MLLAALTKSSALSLSLDGWPDWLVILIGTLVAALVIWVLIKLIKLALWLLLFAVLLGGLATALWVLVHA